MKKRNQLVSALLTGVLLGGTATATVTTAPKDAAAEESRQEGDTANISDSSSEADSEENEMTLTGEGSDSEDGQSGSGEEGGSEGGDSSGGETGGESGGGESGGESSGGESSGGESGGGESSGGESSGGESGGGESSGGESSGGESGGGESSGGESSGGESGGGESGGGESGGGESGGGESGGGESGGGESSGGESGGGESGGGESGGSESSGESAQSSEAPGSGQDSSQSEQASPSPEQAAGQTQEAAADQTAADASGTNSKETSKSSSNTTSGKVAEIITAETEKQNRDVERMRAASQQAAKKAADEEQEIEASKSSGFTSSNRAYYSGTYFVTNAQKRLALNVGFVKIEKVPAMSAGTSSVNILEAKSDTARSVGVLSAKDVCYILSDESDGWAYVESGEVRGFVKMSSLKSGASVNDYVASLGESGVTTAEQLVDPLENTAYRYSLNTTKDVASIIQALGTASVDRQAMISFAKQFIGNPYVWGGESLTNGCDCSGFTQQVYAQFGISLPRTSYEQAEVGVKIPKDEALPGDLLFYARDGVVYHVLMYVGNGQAINASSSATGIIIQDVDYNKVCWGCQYISDTGAENVTLQGTNSSTQASSLQAIGQMAYEGDAAAQEAVIEALAQASLKEWKTYGFCRSVIIAQAINESGWLSFSTSAAGIQSTDNNVLGMNEDLNNNTWTSPWEGDAATRLVPQYAGGGNTYNFESMRLYEDMESCMEDYAAFKVGLHPDLIGETDVDHVIAVGLEGYASNPNYQTEIRELVDKYNLTRFDTEETSAVRPESTETEDTESVASSTEAELDELIDTILSEDETESDSTSVESAVEEILDEEDIDSIDAETADEETDTESAAAEQDGEETVVDADASEAEQPAVDSVTSEAEQPAVDSATSEAEEPAVDSVTSEAEQPEIDSAASEAEQPSEDSSAAAVEEAQEEDSEISTEEIKDLEKTSGSEKETDTQDIANSEEKPLDPTEDTADSVLEPYTTEVLGSSGVRLDTTDYTEDQLELIWAVVAQEDDTSYDGALAVISSVMNRADVNYGGFGKTAFDQLTAESQYAYSPDVEDPLYYERRLGGNVPDFVKQAVDDCLTSGLRNHSYISFRSDDYIDGSVQIGANYYFYETAANAAEAIGNMSDVIGELAVEIPDVTAQTTTVDPAQTKTAGAVGANAESAAETVSEEIIVDVPDAYYIDGANTSQDEEETVILDDTPYYDGSEDDFFSGTDENGYLIIDAVRDADL